MLRKVFFPREAPVIGAVGAYLPDLGINTVLLLVLVPILGGTFGPAWLLVPLPYLLLCVTALAIRECYVVTGEISVRYLRPCPIEVELDISARITEREHPRYLVIEAEVRQGDVLLARSTGRFFPQMRAENAP